MERPAILDCDERARRSGKGGHDAGRDSRLSAIETVMGYIGLLLIGIIGWTCDWLSKGADTERLEELRGQVGSGHDARRTGPPSVGLCIAVVDLERISDFNDERHGAAETADKPSCSQWTFSLRFGKGNPSKCFRAVERFAKQHVSAQFCGSDKVEFGSGNAKSDKGSVMNPYRLPGNAKSRSHDVSLIEEVDVRRRPRPVDPRGHRRGSNGTAVEAQVREPVSVDRSPRTIRR